MGSSSAFGEVVFGGAFLFHRLGERQKLPAHTCLDIFLYPRL
jgi:hypothetical protein